MQFDSETILNAYLLGTFPMAESRTGKEIFWHIPQKRAIFDIYNINIPRSMRQLFRKNIYSFSIDRAFSEVINGCADREDTWINDSIINEYTKLNTLGFAHSVEVWREGKIVGGLYGVHIGGAFFGESMYGKESNVTKLAFYYMCGILAKNKFKLLDSQYINSFTEQLGAIEISHSKYLKLLAGAVKWQCKFNY